MSFHRLSGVAAGVAVAAGLAAGVGVRTGTAGVLAGAVAEFADGVGVVDGVGVWTARFKTGGVETGGVTVVASGVASGVAPGTSGTSNVIAPDCQICAMLSLLISNSIAARRGLAGDFGNPISLPLMRSWADSANAFE